MKTFSGIDFKDETVDYNGEAHTITATGMPDGSIVTYTNAGPFTDVGTYVVGVTVCKEGYKDFTSSATLTIEPIDFEGVTFNDASFEYDGNPHSITITGSLPATAEVKYTSNVANVTNTATDVGSYEITAVITDKNHNPLTLQAVLRIKATDEERFMAYSESGELYFQNAIDDNELYLYDTDSGALVRVNGDNAVDIIPYNNGVMYVDKAAFISAIKTVSYNGQSTTSNNVYTTANMRYVQIDGEVAYYAVNSLLNSKSGIYKVDFSGEEPVATCLSVGSAYYLQLVGKELYFADGANGKKLSKINTSSENQARTVVVDEKINNLVYDAGAFYYTVNNLLGNYIEKYTVSTAVRRKLTIDAGESLTVVDGKLYYVNVDAFTTSMIGGGIYCVSTSPLTDNQSAGVKLIDGGEWGVCSLTSDGDNLYYYDVEGYKLMQYNIDSKETTNLLEGFVKPEDPAPISTGSKLQEYNGNIYYLDIFDGKKLHCYNPATGLNYAVTSDKVVDFNIIGDVLYVNMVSYLVNNDTFSVNLKTGGEMVKINKYSSFEFVSDGMYVYYIEENAAGVKTAIHKCDLDGGNDVIVYDKGVTNLRLVNGKLYFVDGNNIHCYDMQTKADTVVKVDGREIHTTAFDTDGTYLYYRDMYGLGWLNKRLSRCKLDGTENIVMVSGVDPVSITYKDGQVYYYSDTVSSDNGLFKVSANVKSETSGTAVLDASSGYYAKDFVLVGDKLYFVDYKTQLEGDSHLYVVTIGENEPELIK